MNAIGYRRILFWGFVTYSATFFMWAALSAWGLTFGLVPQIGSYVLACIVVFGASRSAGVASVSGAITYGVGLTIVHILLDALVVLPATGIVAFSIPYVWFGYAIVLITPMVAAFISKSAATEI